MIVLEEQLADTDHSGNELKYRTSSAKESSSMATDQLQSTLKQIQALSLEEQLQLIKYLADRLVESQPKHEPRHLVYGEFRNSGTGRMSTEEDFKIAEWNPTEEELNEF